MGFWSKHNTVQVRVNGIGVENVPAEAPQFKRIYTARLDNRASVKITIRTSICGGHSRYKAGELTQPNGRWVLFDPDAIAEKILDPALVPVIQKYVDEIIELDRAYIGSDPDEFTDERGQRWKRVTN